MVRRAAFALLFVACSSAPEPDTSEGDDPTTGEEVEVLGTDYGLCSPSRSATISDEIDAAYARFDDAVAAADTDRSAAAPIFLEAAQLLRGDPADEALTGARWAAYANAALLVLRADPDAARANLLSAQIDDPLRPALERAAAALPSPPACHP